MNTMKRAAVVMAATGALVLASTSVASAGAEAAAKPAPEPEPNCLVEIVSGVVADPVGTLVAVVTDPVGTVGAVVGCVVSLLPA